MSVASRFSRILVVLALLFGLTIVAGPPASAEPQDSGIRLMPVPAQRSSIDTVVATNGVIFFSDPVAHVVRFLAPEGADFIGNEGVVVGNGSSGIPVPGDAANSPMISPTGLAYDEQGDVLFIADTGANMVVAVSGLGNDPTTAQLEIVAGTGVAGSPAFSDGEASGPESALNGPRAVAIDTNSGSLAIADTGNNAVYVAVGVTLFSVVGPDAGICGDDNQQAVTPSAVGPRGVFWADGSLFVADTGNHRVMVWSSDSQACHYTTFAGTGVAGAVTEGPATESKLSAPVSIDYFFPGFVIADEGNHQMLAWIDGDLGVAAGTGSADPIDYNSTADPTSWGIGSISQAKFVGFSILLVDSTNNIFAYLGEATAPSKPTPLGATPGNGSASISFTAPSDNGGRAITKYQFTTNGGSTWTDADAGTTSPVTISGLTNGTNYSVKLRAVNSIGEGEMSSVAVSVTPVVPASVPAAPTAVAATAGDGSVSVAFTAGATGGSAITKYQYRLGAGSWVDAGLTSPIAISGLTNFTTYSIQVRAVNAAGPGAASVAVTARPQLAGPTIGVAYSSGKQGVQVGFAFNRPAGSTLVGFTVRAYAKGTDTVVSSCQTLPNGRSCYIPSLNSGTEYDIRVQGYFTLAGETKVRSSLESATSRVRVNS